MVFSLKRHKHEIHKLTPFNTYLREIVYGGNDGIVTTFAVVAGFAGARGGSAQTITYSFMTVLLFGIANLAADGVSMALGNYLSLNAHKDLYEMERARELYEFQHNPQNEIEESISILEHRGFTKEQAQQMTTTMATNPHYWSEFMMQYEIEMSNPEDEKPIFTSLATFFSFASFGFIPLVPYVFMRNNPFAFVVSIGATCGALLTLGIIRARVTRAHQLRSIAEVIFVGGMAALLAYVVGLFFRT